MKTIPRRVGIAIVTGLALYGFVSLAGTIWRKRNLNSAAYYCNWCLEGATVYERDIGKGKQILSGYSQKWRPHQHYSSPVAGFHDGICWDGMLVAHDVVSELTKRIEAGTATEQEIDAWFALNPGNKDAVNRFAQEYGYPPVQP